MMERVASSCEIEMLSKERFWMEAQKALLTNNPEIFFKTLHAEVVSKLKVGEIDFKIIEIVSSMFLLFICECTSLSAMWVVSRATRKLLDARIITTFFVFESLASSSV